MVDTHHRTPSAITTDMVTCRSSAGVRLLDPAWDDARFPFFGRQLDISAGHLTYDITNLGVNFDDTSRNNDLDQIGIIAQMHHDYAIGTEVRPHVHWMQSAAAIPNMLLKYRIYDQGEAPGAWVLAATTGQAFTYTSGTILQISSWPAINMSTITGVSGFLDIKVYRDTANGSTLFAGADPLTGDWLAKEFDLHYQIDSIGSGEEYTK
jgi:hypothetical protein